MDRRLGVQLRTIMLGAALCVLPMQAAAQQQQVRISVSELLSRLDRLETDVSALNNNKSQFGEDELIRLDQIELELRRMTGIIERLEFEQRQAEQRASKRAFDFETRLQALEAGPGDEPAVASTGFSQATVVLENPQTTDAEDAPRKLPPPQYTTSSPAPAYTAPPTLNAPGAQLGGLDSTPDLSAVPGAPTMENVESQALLSPAQPPAPPALQAVALQDAPLSPQEPAAPTVSAGALYVNAIELLNQGRFEEAGDVLEQIVADHPSDPAAGQANYWLGDMHLRLGRFEFAAQSFLESFRGFPDGPKAPDSLLKLGITLASLGQHEEACLTFTQFAPRYPDAPERLLRRAALESQRAKCGG